MVKWLSVLLFSLFLTGDLYAQGPAQWVISNPTIIDIETGKLIAGKDVWISGQQIRSVVPHRKNYPPSRKVVDASGRFLIPALWDMHMHFGGGDSLVEENQNLLPLFLAHGITAIRDAAADISPAVLSWRNAIRSGTLEGPTIFTAGPKIEGINSIWIGDLEVGTEQELMKAFDSLAKLKVDFIKVTDNTLKPELYLQALREARKRGWPVSAHIPYALTMDQVVDAGLSSVEHMAYALKAGATNEAEIARLYREGTITGKDVMPLAIRNFDEQYALSVYRKMAAKGTAITPTLNISRITAYFDQEDHWMDPYLQYIGQGLQNTYWWRVNRAAGDNAEAIALRHQVFEKAASLLPLLKKAGVLIIAGSDAGYLNSFDYPGRGLHDELGLLVKYGLTPLEALQAAISSGPRYFKMEHQYGKIAPGFFADLLLLNANPLEEICNTRNIFAVFNKGKWYDRKKLDELLLFVKQQAATSPFRAIGPSREVQGK